jgi:hypothetical protein
MKVLEPGKPKEKWLLQHRCTGWGFDNNGCDALLELELEDLFYYAGFTDEKGSCAPSVYFKCACCNKLNALGVMDWPKSYRTLKQDNPYLDVSYTYI